MKAYEILAKPEPWPEQCFVLSSDLFDAASFEEIDATWKDMEELGIAKAPYESFDVVVPEGKVVEVVLPGGKREPCQSGLGVRIRYFNHGKNAHWLGTPPGGNEKRDSFDLPIAINSIMRKLELDGKPRQSREELMEGFARTGGMVLKLLVVMLATRNATKERKECKTLRLGIGSKERNRYTTTIKIGNITESTEEHTPTGAKKRPHLRRGHVRRQHYGPAREFIKKIFIEPVFVNADEGWIAERTAYNVGVQHA